MWHGACWVDERQTKWMNAFETLLLLAIQFSLPKIAASFSCDRIPKRSFVACVPQDQGDVKSCIVHADEIREFRFIRKKKLRHYISIASTRTTLHV